MGWDLAAVRAEAERIVGMPVLVMDGDMELRSRLIWDLHLDGRYHPNCIYWGSPNPPDARSVAILCHEMAHARFPIVPVDLAAAQEWRCGVLGQSFLSPKRFLENLPDLIWEDEVATWEAAWPFALGFGVPRRDYLAARAEGLRTYLPYRTGLRGAMRLFHSWYYSFVTFLVGR